MNKADLDFFQGIVNQILRYITQADIDNEEQLRRADEQRKLFKIFNQGVERKTVNSLNLGGEEELIKLKYGQGCIQRKTRIRKRDGSLYVIYEGRYYNEYGKIKSVYAKSQKECLKLLRQANPPRKKGAPKKVLPTLAEWMLFWYNSFKAETVRESTRRNYERNVKELIEDLGKIKLNDLTSERLQLYFNGISAGNTRKKLYTFLNSCLDKAVVLQKMPFNPCRAVELPKYKKIKRRAFTYDEQNRIFESAPEKTAQVFFFLCVTGLRVGEFLALTKDDFFFDEHFFKVDKAITDGIAGETKTESSNRIVYFTDELFEHFDLSLLGTFTYAGLRSSIRRLCDNLDMKGVSLHSTRHTFSTICHSLGLPDKVLQSLLGHSTLAMTQDTYTHLLKKGSSVIYCYLERLCTFVRTII